MLAASYGTIPLGAGLFGAVAALSSWGGSHPGTFAVGPVFWVDAATFLFSFESIRRIGTIGSAAEDHADQGPASFRAAFRIPIVRRVIVATAGVAAGLGALFSLGVVFVQKVLGVRRPRSSAC